MPISRRSNSGTITPQRDPMGKASSPALLKLATSQASYVRQQQQQLPQHSFQSPGLGVRFSTPAPPPTSQQPQQSQHRSQTSKPRRVPVARKSTDLLRIKDPELRCLAILNSPMIDSRPRGRRSAAGRHSICCLPGNSLAADSPRRPPRLTQPAADDGTSPQAVWRTLFCDVQEADEDAEETEEAVRKYRMLLHQQWELLRFLIDDWKEVSVSEAVPQLLRSDLAAALASAGELLRDTLPAFEAKLATSSAPAAELHAAWSGVEAGIVDARRKFAELEANRQAGWPPVAAATVADSLMEGVAADENNRRMSGQQRRLTRRSLQVV